MTIAQHRESIATQKADFIACSGASFVPVTAGVRREGDTLRPYIACWHDLETPEPLSLFIFQSEHSLPAFAADDETYVARLKRELLRA